MTDERSWQGNWRVRLYERVRERGYDSLTAIAEARPTASLVALAEELGPGDAIQADAGPDGLTFGKVVVDTSRAEKARKTA